MVLEFARPSEARCCPPAGDFFEAVFLQQPQATEAVEKGCFSRISDVTVGPADARGSAPGNKTSKDKQKQARR